MASYHRVLRTFDRTIDDNTLECDYDIHPWDILIDNQRWPGKIRLVGYIDVFFLICYSGEARFEHGIVIYTLRKYYSLNTEKDGSKHTIVSLGHPINLSTKYPKSKLKKYTIVLHKGHTPAMQKEILRGVMQHGVVRLLTDALKLGVVSTAELISKVKETILSGSSLDAVTTKSINALTASNSHNISLSGDQL
ncbi:uncharacterized protein TRIVIDRAFT_158843 [Trichoderma virens Gv29-8]|uniref:Uncharacterized protein n=1 Tax=Hypocrea virens (strain Gv29-8 / FGSC 10586) TaxID=413071 RepID=G9N4D1_HYPVG|nr:uncharacterized protein TRIVIDRAFT_158843 [Trichoderma virens Gv29-8]EHK18456.1 hypothetical protein TRIVIDRAFT_158843 [Trichoderma virens Gv29-8]UKZ52665.1 hypothetical protein TrVGV298_006446 [Trichoderma virens]